METKKRNQTNTNLMYQYNKITKKNLRQFNQVIIMMMDNKLKITTEQKTIHFDLSKDVDSNLKYQIDFIMKCNELLAKHTRLVNYCPDISIETILMNTIKEMNHTNLFLTCYKY